MGPWGAGSRPAEKNLMDDADGRKFEHGAAGYRSHI